MQKSELDRPGLKRSCFLVASLVPPIVGLVSYLAIRIPGVRAGILRLVPYREQHSAAVIQQMMAPRAILLASLTLILILTGTMMVPRWRTRMLRARALGDWSLVLLTTAQVLAVIAVFLDLQFYYARAFGKPIGLIDNDSVLRYVMPQTWKHSQQLLAMLPSDTSFAYGSERKEIFYPLPSFAYPMKFYFRRPGTPDWTQDPAFAALVRERRISYLLDYYPFQTTESLALRPLR